MKSFPSLFALLLFSLVGAAPLHAQSTINVPSAAWGTGQPGEEGSAFSFTLASDSIITVKAMFMTHWLTNRDHVVSNPKATNFLLDGQWYPSPGGPEDFYGYLDRTQWPERIVHIDQQIWIQETISLSKGTHTIQFRNGLMERDDSGSRTIFSYASWTTATIITPPLERPNALILSIEPKPANVSLLPAVQNAPIGSRAVFTLAASGESKTEFSGSDGTALTDPPLAVPVSPGIGVYTYTYLAFGKMLIRWNVLAANSIWIDPPKGPPVNVTSDFTYNAVVNGDYTILSITNGITVSESFHIDLPVTTATATLTVTAGPPLPTGPQVTEFSPVAASITLSTGPAAGQTYPRSWSADGGWAAYLGREGVSLRVVGQSPQSAINRFEIQAKSPTSDWSTLVSEAPEGDGNNGPGIAVPQTFKVKLGETDPQKPLLPADPAQAGKWTLRARVSDATGAWSPWSFEQPLDVLYPIKTMTMAGKTLPPVTDQDWFSASPEKNYTLSVLVP